MSQRDLAYKLQLAGYDMDKNVITRIETNKRYVTDLDSRSLIPASDHDRALPVVCEIIQISLDERRSRVASVIIPKA